MASDDKTSPAPKNGTAVNKEAAAKKDEGQVKDKTTSDADLSKRPFRNSLSAVQLIEQRLCLLQIERVKALSEPAVPRSK